MSEYGQVSQVGVELIFSEKGILQRINYRFIKVDDGTTLAAYKVVMVPFIGWMVSDSSFSQIGLGDQIEFLEQFQGAIDG